VDCLYPNAGQGHGFQRLRGGVASGTSTLLTPHEGEQIYSANDFSPDGKKLLITSNSANGYDNAGLLDVGTKKITWLTKDKSEVSGGPFSPDGKRVLWTTNVDGNTEIYEHDLAAGKTTSLPLPQGVNTLGGADSAFSRDGARLLYYQNGRLRRTMCGCIRWPEANRNE